MSVGDAAIAVPELRESCAHGSLALGVRPEHVRFSDASALRGRVYGTEYLGTNQIVTVETGHGQIRARVSSRRRVEPGENVGIECMPGRLVVFDARDGRALDSDLFRSGADG